MINNNDLRVLKGMPSKMYQASLVILALAFLSSLVFMANSLYLAFHYAELLGLDFSATLELWNENSSLQKTYSSYEHNSLHRLNVAILNFGVCIMLVISLFTIISSRSRNKRVLEALIKSGAVDEKQLNA